MTPDLYSLNQHYYARYQQYRREMAGDTLTRPLSFLEWLLRELWYAECSELEDRAALLAVLAEKESVA